MQLTILTNHDACDFWPWNKFLIHIIVKQTHARMGNETKLFVKTSQIELYQSDIWQYIAYIQNPFKISHKKMNNQPKILFDRDELDLRFCGKPFSVDSVLFCWIICWFWTKLFCWIWRFAWISGWNQVWIWLSSGILFLFIDINYYNYTQ